MMKESRIVRAAESEGGGGGPAAPVPKSAGLTGGDKAAIDAAKAAAPPGSPLPDGWFALEKRPEWLPEKFYDPEKKAARMTDLAKSYGELERKQFTRTDDLKRQVEREIEEARVKARPEKPEGYQAKLPEGFKVDGVDFQPDENNPMLKWWRTTAHTLGLPQAQFEEGVKAYVESILHDAPKMEDEIKALGENGPQRIAKLEAYLSGALGKDSWEALRPLATSAKIIEALEKLADAKQIAASPPQGGQAAPAGDTRTRADLVKMMGDPRYRDPYRRDPAFVREVQELQRRLYNS